MSSDAYTFALYRFNNTGSQGGETDYSSNGRHLDYVGTGTLPSVQGLVGLARRFGTRSGVAGPPEGGRFHLSSSAEIVAFPSTSGSSAFTVEMLVKLSGSTGGGWMLTIEKQSNQLWGLSCRVFNDFLGQGGGGGAPGYSEQAPSPVVVPHSQWVYIAMTGAGSASPPLSPLFYFYVNGVLAATTGQAVGGSSSPAAAAGSELLIGDYWNFPSGLYQNYNGAGTGFDINELRMSVKVRSPTEIANQAIAYGLLGSSGSSSTIVDGGSAFNTGMN